MLECIRENCGQMLVRLEMERVAKSAKVEPTRISFVESLRLIRDDRRPTISR